MKTIMEAVYDTTPDNLWATVDFHQPSENIMPPIVSSVRTGEGVGARKINTLAGEGGEVSLMLVYYAPKNHAFNYVIQESPLPVANYVGEVRVTGDGEGQSKLSWCGTYDASGAPDEQADEILRGFYGAIAEKIAEIFPRVT